MSNANYIGPSAQRIHAVIFYLATLDQKSKKYQHARLAASFKQGSVRLFLPSGFLINTWGERLFEFKLFDNDLVLPTFEEALKTFCTENEINYGEIPNG